MLPLKEYNYLTKMKHKMSKLYMLSKLYKSKKINEIMPKQQCEYINIENNVIVKARPIVDGTVYRTSGISEIFHTIMEPCLEVISHIGIDCFDFKNRLDKHCPNGTTLSTCDIKSLYPLFNLHIVCFIQQLNAGLKNCKIIYRYCDVLINNLSLKAS